MSQPQILWTLGLNHESAPLDVRARLAFTSDRLGWALTEIKSAVRNLSEVALLSTCNRTELYGLGDHDSHGLSLDWLAKIGALSVNDLQKYTYLHSEDAAAKHALRVASGLDSMVLGESQILGQFKEAVRAAGDAGTLGATLHQLFKQAFAVAKDVRTNTLVGSHSISMAAAATRLASGVFEDWRHTRVLLVGAGEMIELSAAHFAAKTPKRMAICNRTRARGVAVAERFSTADLQIETLALAELPAHLHEFDVVLSSTASTLPIIGLGAVQQAIRLRKHRPMVMVDLAVPRDIEPAVQALTDVYLYTVDDLCSVVQSNLANRAAAVTEADKIIDAGLAEFIQWQAIRKTVVPKIQALNEQSALWQEQEIERVKKQFLKDMFERSDDSSICPGLANKELGQAQGERIELALQALARNLANKFLHLAYKSI